MSEGRSWPAQGKRGAASTGGAVSSRSKLLPGGILVASIALACLAPGARAVSVEQITQGNSGLGNGAFWGGFDASSADGTRVIFDSAEKLTSDDTDGNADTYERANGVTTRLSFGPNGGNANSDVVFLAASDDASHVFFQTGEALVAADTDGKCYVDAEGYLACRDVYERSGGTTSLVSTSATSPNSNNNARLKGISKNGLHAFFTTAEQLVPADTDNAVDVYERFGGNTTLVSTGPASTNSDDDAVFRGCSDDGTRVFIETVERLTSADTDSEADVYQRSAGTTTLLSTGPAGGNGATPASFKGASADGSRVFFETDERLTSGDTDSSIDVYQRSAGTTTLLSTGPAGGNGATDAYFEGASKDGARVWFETKESLVAGDSDGRQDVYERSGGTTAMVSTGPTGGSGAFDASFEGASQDGSRVWIGTLEQLAPTDLDSAFDIYERSGGSTLQLSLGPGGGNGASDAFFDRASADGTRVFFETPESLVAADTDSFVDVYQRLGGTTTLVSPAPSGSSTSYANLVGTNADGTRVFFTSGDKLAASDTDTQTDIYASVDIPGYPRPKGATPFVVPLVIAYRDCTSANSVHGAPLSYQSCKPPVPESNWLTVGTPDANGQPAKSVGSVAVTAVAGDPSTPADEADARLALSVSDVRNKSGLGDYAGELEVRLDLRVTDKLNGASPVDPATISDFPFEYKGVCTTTSDTTVGSICSIKTTADAVIPGAVTEVKRTIWEVGTVQVFDGGSDGDVDTLPNTLFERQGVFVP
jgi:hypothetical protein